MPKADQMDEDRLERRVFDRPHCVDPGEAMNTKHQENFYNEAYAQEDQDICESTASYHVESLLCMFLVHEMKSGARAEPQEIDSRRRDILAQLPRLNADAVVTMEVGLVE